MESHVLNTYHQARYRTIGHKLLRTSESLSEGSSSQTSPDYQIAGKRYENDCLWKRQNWGHNQTVNMTKSQDTSSDDDENIEVQEVSFEDRPLGALHLSEPDPVEDNTLVEGADYDVIQVFAVDPDLDLEASSEDEEQEDYVISDKIDEDAEYLNPQDKATNHVGHAANGIADDLNFNLDTPVVSNVDEYFIKEDKDRDILAVKDEPVVNDVDEYFIKEQMPKEINVDDFFIKEKPPEVTQFDVPKPVNVDEFFVADSKKVIEKAPKEIRVKLEVQAKESDLEVLPNIEDLKRFLLEDMTCTKFKNAQRSCSLPQSPMHNICLDIDDSKTCLSFEDLNLDLSDLTFDNDKSGKSDDIPRTLTDEDVNSFLITTKPKSKETVKEELLNDDLSHEDMEIERPVESIVHPVELRTNSQIVRTSTPIPNLKASVLDFAIEKTGIKKEIPDVKVEVDDFVDVESCNDVVFPVLAANNLNSLLEQFEATEKLNTNPKRQVIKSEEQKVKSVLTNGMRLQDAGVQLNKTKMRQILMPSTINATVRRSPSPVHSDHDYCSFKKRYSLPNIKGGQSLLKPEVLSSNSRILNSRHRSCKNKKVVYALSSDDESDKNNAKYKKPVTRSDDIDVKVKKLSVKETIKLIPQATRKKLSPVHSAPNDCKDRSNISVIVKDACKASDTPCSQNSNGSIKLTIKNKSEVILNCDDKDSQKDKTIEKSKVSVSDKETKPIKVEAQTNKNKNAKHLKELDSNKVKGVSSVEKCTNLREKETARPKEEHFYTALFSNKQDVQIPQVVPIKSEKRSFEEEISIATKIPNKEEQPHKKKKLNLQEYKLRKCISSNSSSATVSPESIFPDMPNPFTIVKAIKNTPNPLPNGSITVNEQVKNEAPKKIFDPIREASRKILMNNKKQKAEAIRKRDEDIVMSKIPKVENLQLQPLISDAEMLKIVGMAPPEASPVPVVNEKPQMPTKYEEIVMVSVGTNTDSKVFKGTESSQKAKNPQSPEDSKSLINFKIKKSDNVLKQNVFDSIKRDKKSPVDEKKHTEKKIDKKRFKDITATLKSVERHVDTKISSNSLFASIQDVVMKKAPNEVAENSSEKEKQSKSNSPKRKTFTPIKTTIVREYDINGDHGEDKIILHLNKERNKPQASAVVVQTDSDPDFGELSTLAVKTEIERTPSRKRNDSDMSMSSESSSRKVSPTNNGDKLKKPEQRSVQRSQSIEKRSRSKERHDRHKRLRSRSRTRRRRRSYSRSRSRSRSRGRYRRHHRSDSSYRRKRRSRSYRRRSPSPRRDYRPNRSRSRKESTRSRSPIKRKSPVRNGVDKKFDKSYTPPLRKPTVSESSNSSTSSSSSSSSNDSRKTNDSRRSSKRRSLSPYRRDDYRKMRCRSPNSSEDRESNTPVEERRIVFVGRLEKDITKSALRSQFCKFGPVVEVRLHTKEDGSRYGFVTFSRARDAWSAVEAAGTFPRYDVGFGGRRAFCRHSYADLDGLEAKYTESAFHGAVALPPRRNDDMSFEQMLLEMKKKLSQRKGEKKANDTNQEEA